MILYVDGDSNVKAVDHTEDETLTPLYVDETNELFPFKDRSVAFICSYKVNVTDGVVTMMTPYRDSKVLDYIDEVGHDSDNKTEALEILLGEV